MPKLSPPGAHHVALIAIVCILSGCSSLGGSSLSDWWHNGFKVGPNYARPAAPVADSWIEAESQQVRFDRPRDVYWWTVLNDPNLNALIEAAYEQNLTLRTAGMRVLEARALRAIAQGQMFPQLQQMVGGYARTQLSRNELGLGNLPGGVQLPRAFDNWSGGFDMAWELDIWGRFRRNLEAADADLDASIEDYDAVLISLIAEVAAAYVDMRTFQQRITFAEDNVKIQSDTLRLVKLRKEEGEDQDLDVQLATSNLENVKSTIPVLQIGLQQASNRLCVLLGIPPRKLNDLVPPRANPIPNQPENVSIGMPAELIRRRPDIRKAEREAAAASARIGVAASDLYPRFSINGTINLSSRSLANLFNSGSTAGILNPVFDWNILNYGRIMNNIAAHDAKFQQTAIEFQNTVLTANEEVENALIAYLKRQQQRKDLARSVAAYQRSVEIGNLKIKEGEIGFIYLYVLQSDLAIQQDKLAESEGDVILSLIDLFKALGTGWQIRLGVESPEEVDAANRPANRPAILPPVAPPDPDAADPDVNNGRAEDARDARAKNSRARNSRADTETSIVRYIETDIEPDIDSTTVIESTISLEPGSLRIRSAN